MNESGIFPTGTKVLVRPIKTERVTSGGIFIPEAEAAKYDAGGCKAEVIAVGPCAFQEDKEYMRRNEMDGVIPRVGNFIFMAKWAGNPVPGKDGEYRIINDEDVTAILENKDVGGNANF